MVPADFTTFFATTAAVAGALIGLLFVAISVAPTVDAHGARVEKDVRAGVAFSALIDALVISLFALVPNIDLGTTALIVGLASLSSCVALMILLVREGSPGPRRRRQIRLLVVQGALFGYQAAVGAQVMGGRHVHSEVTTLAILVIVLFLVGIARAWLLIGARDSGLVTEMVATLRTRGGSDDREVGA